MGQRYESKKKSVSENREASETNAENRETLKNEYAFMSELTSMIGELEDESAEAVIAVENVGEQKNAELQEEHKEIEEQKEELSEEITDELDKLNDGLRKMERLGRFEFGKGSVSDARSDYKKQIEKYKDLLSDLGESSSDSVSDGGGFAEQIDTHDDSFKDNVEERNDNSEDASIIGFAFNSFMNSRDPDVKKWTSYLDSFSSTIKRQYSERYGQYITPGKLDVPLSETLVYETQALFESKGIERGVLGYNDGIKSRVAVGTGHELQTTIHENLHQLSANGNAHGIIEYDNSARKNVQINEAITEMLTQRTLGEQYGSDYSAYSDNRDSLKLIESVMGEDIISQAYFQNRPELMRNEIDSKLGYGTWEQLSDAFDDCLSSSPHTRESGRIRRDSIVNRYLMTATNANGGENNWMAMLS